MEEVTSRRKGVACEDHLATLTGVLYETDIPVVNQPVKSVETYPAFLVGAFVAITVVTVALLIFRKR
jgi:hypothetical protein